jgi:hypothetical protein
MFAICHPDIKVGATVLNRYKPPQVCPRAWHLAECRVCRSTDHALDAFAQRVRYHHRHSSLCPESRELCSRSACSADLRANILGSTLNHNNISQCLLCPGKDNGDLPVSNPACARGECLLCGFSRKFSNTCPAERADTRPVTYTKWDTSQQQEVDVQASWPDFLVHLRATLKDFLQHDMLRAWQRFQHHACHNLLGPREIMIWVSCSSLILLRWTFPRTIRVLCKMKFSHNFSIASKRLFLFAW